MHTVPGSNHIQINQVQDERKRGWDDPLETRRNKKFLHSVKFFSDPLDDVTPDGDILLFQSMRHLKNNLNLKFDPFIGDDISNQEINQAISSFNLSEK